MNVAERDRRAVACLGCRLTLTDSLPLNAGEFRQLSAALQEKSLRLGDIFSRKFTEKEISLPDGLSGRISRLLARREEWNARLRRYAAAGIGVMTFAEEEYPARIRRAAGDYCPPVLFYYGNEKLLEKPMAGYVGVRDCDEDDIVFARNTVAKTVARGYGVVSGGARGIDCAAEFAALGLGADVVEFTAFAIEERTAFAEVRSAASEGRMVIVTAELPDEGFSAARALMRNNYIYMLSRGAVAVRAHLRRGGTWTGVVRNLKRGWCTQYCRKLSKYLGNEELIALGAKPIDEQWDGVIVQTDSSDGEGMQLSLFDDLS